MDRQMLLDHLALAEQQIAEGERHLTRQRAVIEGLERGGHDTTSAKQVLDTLQASQVLHEQHRSDILRQLDP